jgi:Zn finger protein HypA/HybF involved in hydrogenase expression
MALLSGRSIHNEGARFEVICKRCNNVFVVIRNWGGGIRNANNENKNPAECPKCGSLQLEIY